MKRPLYIVGMSFGLALLSATVMGFHLAFIGAVLCALLFLLTVAVKRLRRYVDVTAALLAACAAFAVFAAWEYYTVQPLQSRHGETVAVTMWTEELVSETEESLTYFARVRDGELPYDTRVLLRVTNSPNAPQLYDCVTADVRVEAIDEWRAQNVFVAVWVNDCTVAVSEERPWNYGVLMLRTRLLAQMETKADGDVSALIRAICFGDKSVLSDTVRNNFAAAGISHITAVSGFHMSIVALGLFKLLCCLKLRRRIAALLTVPVPFLFAIVTGLPYSAMRAGVMACFVLVAAMFRREADPRNSLGAAVVCLLLFDITAIYDLGFQLSVAATWGILLVGGLQRGKAKNRWCALGRGLQMTVAAVVATLPFSALYFGEISVLSPLTNLVAQPLAMVVVSVGMIGTLLLNVPFLVFVGSPCILVAGLAARGLLFIGEIAAAIPFAALRLREPYLVIWALAVPFALLLGWRLLRGRGLRLTAMLLVIAFCVSTLAFRLGMRGVTVLSMTNVSGGTVVVMERDGRYAAILMGEPSPWQTEHLLTTQGVEQLDAAVLAAGDTVTVQTDVPLNGFLLSHTNDTPKNVSVALWENTMIQWENGWCRLTVSDRTILIAPRGGDVQTLPADWRTADIAVIDREPPQGMLTLALGEVVLCCGDNALPLVMEEMPWGVYPITVTADDTVTVKLR